MGRGPYRILISEFDAPRDPMALGNPARDRAVAEMCRLFGVNDELADGILGSVPIVIFVDLDQHTAGVLAKRLMSLVELGCQITTTTRVADDLPCMNWPELPPIASLENEPPPRAAAAAAVETVHHESLSCPSCGLGLKIVPDDGSVPRRRAPRGEAAASTPPPPPPEPEPEPEPEDDGDDWMATPRSLGPTPEPRRPSNPPSTTTRRKSTRFDSPALLRSQPPPPPDPLHAGEPQARGVATAVREPKPEEDHLRVELSDSSIEELTDFDQDEAPTSPSPVSDMDDLGWDSDADLTPISEPDLDLDPIRGPASEDDLEPLRAPGAMEDFGGSPATSDSNGYSELAGLSDLESAELIQDSSPDNFSTPASTSDVFGSREGPTKTKGRDPFEDSEADEEDPGFGEPADQGLGPGFEDSGSDLLDQTPPHRMHDGSASRFRSDLDFLDEPSSSPSRAFDDLDELADPPPARKPSRSRGAIDPSLSDVLDTFGPEDSQPLDSLDPSPPKLSRRDSGRRGSPEISDILEPLDPDEALKIMKSKRVDSGRHSTASSHRMGDDPSSLEPLDPDEARALLASEQPLDESDDDLFGDPPPKAKSKSRGSKTSSDPFARTRKRKKEEGTRARGRSKSSRREEPSRGRSKKREEPSRGRSGRSSKSSRRDEPARSKKRESGRTSGRSSRRSGDDSKRSGRRRSSSPPKGGPGKHGLVLSRILDPDKKETAAELIKEIRGLSLDEARRLTDRTIIPVLKDVTREEAEYHLDTFKDKNIAGRITTRQR